MNETEIANPATGAAGMFASDFDALEIGDSYRSPGTTVSQRDVAVFAGLTGDHHPIHVDPEWAASGPFGRPIAHGLLVLSLAVGALPLDPDRVVALRRFRETVFKRPVAVGERIVVECRVKELREIDSGTGIVACDWRIGGDDGRLRARAVVEILWRRGARPDPSAGFAGTVPLAADAGLEPVTVDDEGGVEVLV